MEIVKPVTGLLVMSTFDKCVFKRMKSSKIKITCSISVFERVSVLRSDEHVELFSMGFPPENLLTLDGVLESRFLTV